MLHARDDTNKFSNPYLQLGALVQLRHAVPRLFKTCRPKIARQIIALASEGVRFRSLTRRWQHFLRKDYECVEIFAPRRLKRPKERATRVLFRDICCLGQSTSASFVSSPEFYCCGTRLVGQQSAELPDNAKRMPRNKRMGVIRRVLGHWLQVHFPHFAPSYSSVDAGCCATQLWPRPGFVAQLSQ